jgi:hypothetical protein
VRFVNFVLSALALLCTLAAGVAQSAESSTIYIARRGWHIDIGLAVDDLTMPLAAVVSELPRSRYVFFGFGDRHYLLAKNHHGPTLLRALWPGDGIILVTGLEVMPDEAFGAANVVALAVSQARLRALQGFIVGSFRESRDELRAYREGPYAGSLYYLASPTYSAVHTCNTWGAEVLQASGFNVSTGVVCAGQLWSQVNRLHRSQGADTECTRAGLTDSQLGERPAFTCAH